MRFKCITVAIVILAAVGVWQVREGQGSGARKEGSQDTADLMATVDNPKVAALILPSGGHVGFSAYCPAYYLSLITNFFDPQTGPAALQEKALTINSDDVP